MRKKRRHDKKCTGDGKCDIGIKIRHYDKVYSVENSQIPLKLNQYVVVETNRGVECGQVKYSCNHLKKKKSEVKINKVIRYALAEDIEKMQQLEKMEQEAFAVAAKLVEEINNSIGLVSVEYIFDGSKAIIHYKNEDDGDKTPKKINTNEIVKQLSQELKMRVELRHVGPRGEAKLIGGVGNCGRGLCCGSWLDKSKPVTIKMAKEQGLPINIPKLSGVCGRLMCCLQYERQNYERGTLVETSLKEMEKYEEIFESKEGSDE